MAKKPTVVEINGRKYDADTGRILSSGSVSHDSPSVSGQMIDGFAAPHRTRVKQPAVSVHKATQKSKKLHPAIAKQSMPKKIVAEAKAAPVANSKSDLSTRQSFASKIKPERQQRAQQSARSDKVGRFNSEPAANEVPKFAAPESAPPPKQARRQVEAEDQQPKSASWFSRLRASRPKLLPTTAGVAATLMLVGYVTYLNLPNMALRVAASRAGFEASLPGYKPSGFKLDGPISYSPGQIAINFGTSADDRQFTLTQRQSTWDSKSLLDNFVVRENKRHITFQEQGLTIYVYDESNATWVDGGIWYTIEGQSLLSSEQLLKIAASL